MNKVIYFFFGMFVAFLIVLGWWATIPKVNTTIGDTYGFIVDNETYYWRVDSTNVGGV